MDEDSTNLYTFKVFRYECIQPNAVCQIPYARSGHRIGADSANLYSFGGYNPVLHPGEDEQNNRGADNLWVESYPLFRELWKFNYASKKWSKFKNCSSMPLELASNAMVLHQNILMVYGGTGSPFGHRCSNQLYICNVDNETGTMHEVKTTGQIPTPLYGQAVVYHCGYLYAIGGTTGFHYTCDIHRLNLKTQQWEIVYVCDKSSQNEPEGRYRHEVAFDGDNIYVFGGGTAQDTFSLDILPTFNLEKKSWTHTETLKDPNYGFPPPRRCHGAVQITTDAGVQAFITGGYDGFTIFDDLWRLDLQTHQWTCFNTCRLPRPVYFHAAALSPEGRIYVFGGIYCSEEYVSRSNAIYSAWLCIPKLSEMCWEAVLHYSPHIVDCDSDDLINVGLPRHFVQRLGYKNARDILSRRVKVKQ